MHLQIRIAGWAFACLLLLSMGCGRDAVERVCRADSECVEGRSCVDGVCVLPDDGSDAVGDGVSPGDAIDPDAALPDALGPDAEQPDSVGPDIISPSCSTDRDCPANQSCEQGHCRPRPECLIDTDCADGESCIGGRCTYSPDCTSDANCDEGFECVGGQCFEKVCRGPQDCEDGEVCDAGECVVPPAAVSCFVASQTTVISLGQLFPLQAFALDQDGEGISAAFAWTSSDPAVATIDANGRNAVGAGGEGSTTISARTDGGVACDGALTLVGQAAVSTGNLRVVVVDAESGAAIAGAQVVVAGGASATTSARGVASLQRPDDAFSVTVFSDDHNYVTVHGISASDIRIPVSRRSGSGPVAGFTGKFDLSQINTSGDMALGLAGASIAGGLLDMDLKSLLGETFVTSVSIPGMGGSDVPLPGGLVVHGSVFGFDLNIKQTYYANAAGGARLGWGLAGRVPAMQLMQLFQGGDSGNILTTLLPLFSRFDHTNRPLNLEARPRIVDSADINRNGDRAELVPDYNAFPTVSLKPSVRQNLVTEIDVSNFPQMSGDVPASVAVLVGGVLLDGSGFVPLGISATADDDNDGRPDVRRLTLAPPAGALAGGRLAMMAIAFDPEQLGIENGVELPDEFSVSLWNGQSLPAQIGLGTFPDASTGRIDSAARTISIDADAGPLYRIRMVGETRAWDVWSVGPEGTQGAFAHVISIPSAGAHSDLFVDASVFVDAVAAQVSIDQLVKATGIGLEHAGLVSTSFNRTKLR